MNTVVRTLVALARRHGDRWFDSATQLCVGPRDTLWYAIALLLADDAALRERGDALLRTTPAADGTHSPATMLAILHVLPERLSPATKERLVAAMSTIRLRLGAR